MGADGREQASFKTEGEPERDAAFCVFLDLVVLEEQSTNPEAVLVASQTSMQILVQNAVAGFPLHVEELLDKLVLETLTTSQKSGYNQLSAALETLGINTVQKVVNSPELI